VQAAEDDFRSAIQHAIAAGERLIEAKALVKHGEWLPWLRENTELPERTARSYTRLARESATVADLPTVREAVAVLTAPKAHAEPESTSTEDDFAQRLAEHWRAMRAEAAAKRDALQEQAESLRDAGDHIGAAKAFLDVAAAEDAVIRLAGYQFESLAEMGGENDTPSGRMLSKAMRRYSAACFRYADADPGEDPDELHVAEAVWQESGDALKEMMEEIVEES
jgi:hypothetical protein